MSAIVYSSVHLGADHRKHQSPASLAFVWVIHRGPVNSPHKWPTTGKIFPFDEVTMGFLHFLWDKGTRLSVRVKWPCVSIHYVVRRLAANSREVLKPRDYFNDRIGLKFWQASRQHCCRGACQISERSERYKPESRGLETSRDLVDVCPHSE